MSKKYHITINWDETSSGQTVMEVEAENEDEARSKIYWGEVVDHIVKSNSINKEVRKVEEVTN